MNTPDKLQGASIMRPTTPLRLLVTRMLSALLAWSMAFGPVTAAYAEPTPLADVPIAAKVSAKPNIIYTLDDSGSMQENFLPDYVTNAGTSIPLSNITRAGNIATATLSAANWALLSVGDFVTVAGVNQPEYNGYYEILSKPTGTTFTYQLAPPLPVGTTTTGTRVLLTSSAYCRGGVSTATCARQPMNISQGVVWLTSIERPLPLATGGVVTATAKWTGALPSSVYNQLGVLQDGDEVLIQHSAATPIPATVSAPYYGLFTISNVARSVTLGVGTVTFTYQITAVGSPLAQQTPRFATGNRQLVLTGGTFAAPPLHASEFNRLAYNPSVTYYAPKKADGTPLTNARTDTDGNYATTLLAWNSASVDRDPFDAFERTLHPAKTMWPANTFDTLGARVNVPLYCNSDWPLLVNDANWPAGPNGIQVLDVGDHNGQYSASAGQHCRINGTAYAALGTSPAVTDDYNYPWQPTAGVGAQFFWRTLNVKSLWCDKTSPYWPRNGTIIGCNGGTFNPPSTIAQYCQNGGNDSVCTGDYSSGLTYVDVATGSETCDLSAEWCSTTGLPAVGVPPECRACRCVPNTPRTLGTCYRSDTNLPGSGSCNCTGLGCSPPACPDFTITPATCTGGTPVYANTPATSANCTSFLWDPITGQNQTVTLLDDAGAPGTVGAAGTTCRHNNYTYAVGGAAGPNKYGYAPHLFPGEGAGTAQKFDTQVYTYCPAVGTQVAIPRHYYIIDSVDFCATRNATANDQWRGFGTGVCQDRNDLGQYKDVAYGKFTRIDLFPGNPRLFPGNANYAATAATAPYPKGSPLAPAGRVFLDATPTPENSEAVNYANWYAYYSTRLNAGKSTSATAFSYLTNVPPDPIAYRVGFHNLGEEPVNYGGSGTPIIWLDVADWTQAQRDAWYAQLFGIYVSTFKTPIMSAMLRIGNLIETGGSGGLGASTNPLPGSAADPIDKKPDQSLISCQNNYHILFTDGKQNQVTGTTLAGDQDATVPGSLAAIPTIPPENVLETLRPLAAGSAAWPRPFVQGTPAVSDTLSDIATYYWSRDLRPSLKNDVPASSSKGTNDLDPTKDVAWWQHVNFSAISFGAEGTLDAVNQPLTVARLTPQSPPDTPHPLGNLSWPDLTAPWNPIKPRGAAQGAVAVDDLWHATMMSRGTFVFARSPIEVSMGLARILAGIQNQRKSRAGAAFGGRVLNNLNNIIFEPTIEPGWAGDLLKVEINPADGAEVRTWWQASQTLADQIDPVKLGCVTIPPAAPCEPWLDPQHRRIVTLTGSTGPGIPFQFADLSPQQLDSLGANDTQRKKVIAYLRGGKTWYDGTKDHVIEGISVGQFRVRSGVLGDLANAQPVIVFAPDRPYYGPTSGGGTDPGYEQFKIDKAGRAPRVVAPANDGMVHVFDTGPMGVDPMVAGGGTEVFAFIPRALMRGVVGSSEDPSSLQALTYQDGGVPIYRHHMYVDSSPRAADVQFSDDSWHSIVVGGLGKGGNSYYALDLTDADAADEDAAAAKVLWEWSDPEVKYSSGRPVIVKVRDSAYPNGRWVVIVTGGYDNASGLGKVFILDAQTGNLLSTITTAAGSPPGVGLPTIPSTASGLAQIHAFVKNQSNQIAEQIYGGDLLGNVWRIDVSVADSYKTAPAVLFAELTAPDGTAQPVTVAPQIEIDISNGVDRYLFIGTGRLLETSDLTLPTPPQTQTMYAIRDGTLQTPSTTGLPILPRVTMASIDTASKGVNAIVGGAPNGWYHDLPNEIGDSQRIVVDPQADVNIAAYVGTKVQDDPCLISLPATLYARDYTTGESLALADDGVTVISGIDFLFGLVDIATVGMIQADGSTQVLGILGSQEVPGTKPAKIENKFTGVGDRLSWRLLGGE
ncbi:MAG: hypothetical protein IT518_04990 [Burkholderiales bacterium]|nr:hypothetical protein [Burkholderiales bacterium]